MDPEMALALCRLGHDGSVMLLWGAFGYLAALVPRDLGREIGRCLGGFRFCAVTVALLSTGAILPIEVASIGSGGWSAVLDPATVHAVLVETSVGRAWQAQAIVALLLAGTLLLPTDLRAAATAVGSGVALAALATTGHAALHEGWLGALHRLNDGMHVLAGGAWLGALVPFVLVLAALDDRSTRREAGLALRRFSMAGQGAVALVLVTGVANTVLVLGRWPTNWSVPYEAMLAAKIAVVGVMAAMALVNRYLIVPRMGGAQGWSVRALRRSTLAELALGVAVVGLVSMIGLRDPA